MAAIKTCHACTAHEVHRITLHMAGLVISCVMFEYNEEILPVSKADLAIFKVSYSKEGK